IVADFVRRTNTSENAKDGAARVSDDKNSAAFFDGIVMVDDRRLLRRVTLSLCGRLPTQSETDAVQSQGLEAMPGLLDQIMKEDAFYDRLREAFNDIFLTVGYNDGAESALSYEHFENSRHWTQKYDL